ncbi:putative peptidase [Rubripirellula lacrimiformis]|uniref:Putative peptidase n=1 Tax=Rubripirellula lacrimiformis TaxID=1930273 RepID=A0A517NBA4_9BACT|nr:Xaa-Pro peptidase family protein [Rubripirellula lacrimiformis]QDT04415.1 putative peptidase [Rubripirellula lacrimiformis]
MNSRSNPRLETLAAKLDSLKIDAMLVTDEVNVRYLSGFTGDSSALLVTTDQTTVLSDGRYDTQLADECPTLLTAIRPPDQTLTQLIAEFLASAGLQRIGIESNQWTLAAFNMLSQTCTSVGWVQTTGVVEGQRMIKDADEIAITRRAVDIAERAFQSILPMLPGRWTEREVAHELESKMRFLGAEGCSFSPIVAAGPMGALPHYHPRDQKLIDPSLGGEPTLLVDWGAKYKGYASDLTRTLHLPNASDRFRRAYAAVLEAQLAAIDAIRPGAKASDIDAIARGVLQRHGMADAFIHGLGHGTGLQIHESPRMSASSPEALSAGMIVTVEPGVYFAGEFGIRIEDDVLVTPSGHEVLSRLPKGLEQSEWLL